MPEWRAGMVRIVGNAPTSLAETPGFARPDYFGGETLASGQAMLSSLASHPVKLFQIDEFGDFLADVLGPKSQAHRKAIATHLKTLYRSAGSIMFGTEYADQQLVQPAGSADSVPGGAEWGVSLICNSQPQIGTTDTAPGM